MEIDWARLTPEERRARWFERMVSPEGIEFVSPEAEENYKLRAQRMVAVYQVQEPDRVPVNLPISTLPLQLAGINLHTAMYEPEKIVPAYDEFNSKYDLDSYATPMMFNGRVYDLLDCKLHRWPGHGLPLDSVSLFQFVEGEYMKADEYDDLIDDPSDFWMRTFLPRILGIWEPFARLSPLTDIIEHPSNYFMPLADPEVRSSLQKMIDIGLELDRSRETTAKYGRRGSELGYPPGMMGAFAKAPFDTLGDTLRGTQGIWMDMYRQPDKLLAALEVITGLTIKSAISQAYRSGQMIAIFPLHKGADGWMSQKQFEKFYWPSLKKVIDGLIAEGIMVTLFAEGSFESRLDSVNEFPKGMVHWMFDQTDMAKAKAALGDKCSISGNVPASLMVAGTPEEVREHCRRLIEVCAPGGGYILAPGNMDIAGVRLENVLAMDAAAKEYGVYRK